MQLKAAMPHAHSRLQLARLLSRDLSPVDKRSPTKETCLGYKRNGYQATSFPTSSWPGHATIRMGQYRKR